MSDVYEARLAALRQQIPEAEPHDAAAALAAGALLVDIREPDEIAAGMPRGAKRVTRGHMEREVAALALLQVLAIALTALSPRPRCGPCTSRTRGCRWRTG